MSCYNTLQAGAFRARDASGDSVSLQDRSAHIDRDRPVSLADQVADDLRSHIDNGEITGRLPSEAELSEKYGVSRVTIRRSIGLLSAEGLVTVLHGKGTYVSE